MHICQPVNMHYKFENLLLFPQCQIIIIVFSLTRYILAHLKKRRKINILMLDNSLRFKNLETFIGLNIRIQLKELPFPNKGLTLLMNSLAIRIGLSKQRFVEIIVYLALCLNLLIR